LQTLGTQERDWTAIGNSLDDWQRTIKRREDEVASHSQTLKDLAKKWSLEWPVMDFYDQHGSNQGKQLRDTIRPILQKTVTQINQTAGDVSTASLQLAELKQEVDTQSAWVKDILYSVRQDRAAAFSQLFVRNGPPLWSVSIESNDKVGLFAQSRDSFASQLNAVAAYIQRRYENVGLQIALLVLLALGFFRLRLRLRLIAATDAAMKQVSLVFASPVGTALVLSLLLSALIYPQAPRLFWAMVGAAALIPTVIILRRLMDRRLLPILNALVVFYFVDQLRDIVAVVPVMARFLLMLEMLGGAVLLLVFIRSTHQEKENPRLWEIVRGIGWMWAGVFMLAFAGDVIGYYSLANLMGDAALGSAYLAVILFACVRVVTSLLEIGLHSRPLILLKLVRLHQAMLLNRLQLALYWLVSAAWFVAVLGLLSLATPAWDILGKVLSIQFGVGDTHLTLRHVLKFLFIVYISFKLSRFSRFVLEEDVYDRFALPGGIPYAISKIVNYIVLLIGFFLAITALGVETTQFTILASAFTLGIGFGLQNTFNNFVSGLILLFERPVRVGDVIQMNDTTGVVGHIGIRASTIRTPDSAEIIVPNGNLISNTVTNWTLSNRQRGLLISISLASTAEPGKMVDLLTHVAATHPMVIKSPPPQAFLTKLNADSFSYDLHFWTNNADRWEQIRSEVAVALHTELSKQQIPIR
jgi:potassium efflux system protein